MADERAQRAARNEAAFRAVNEALHRSPRDGDALQLVCECSDPACREPVVVSRATYEAARSDARRFLVAPGHEIGEVEDVVDRGEGYCVVRKHEAFAPIVEQTDPRRQASRHPRSP